jgi:hypothetical protein
MNEGRFLAHNVQFMAKIGELYYNIQQPKGLLDNLMGFLKVGS